MTRPLFGPDYGFGLYIHWPYCSKICPYCDFNVYAAKSPAPDSLVRAMCDDLRRHRAQFPDHPACDSVFFGGGTPSLLSSDQMATLLDSADQTFGLKQNAEITLEANPNDVLRANPEDWQAAGINRLSLGVQSLQDEALAFLGRDHDGHTARRAIDQVATTFPNHSLDFIYARPDQSLKSWQNELEAILSLGAPHLSLYELTIEDRTAFGKRAKRGELIPLDEDRQADLYEATDTLCQSAGLTAYEVANYARATTFQARHNLIYWRSGDWIGVGPGAHGRLTRHGERFATEAARRPNDYEAEDTLNLLALSKLDQVREIMAMGLRPAEGIALDRLQALMQGPLDQTVLDSLLEAGLIQTGHNRLALTPAGRLLADHITEKLAP